MGTKMRFKEYLQEEYLTRFDDFEIFKNSSIKEMKKINHNGVRLLINMKTKNYYVFDFSLLHDKAYHIIKAGKNTEEFDQDSIVRAEADFSSGKLYIIWFKPWIWTKNIKEKDVEAIFKEHGVSVTFNEKARNKSYNIGEEYLGLARCRFRVKERVEVFKNPSKKEMVEASHGPVRFIVDFLNKNLYIAEAYNLIHNDILDFLMDEEAFPYDDVSDDDFWDYCYAGFAKLINGKFEIIGNSEGQDDAIHGANFFKYSDSWLKSWFHMPFKKKIKEITKQNLSEEYAFSRKVAFGDTMIEVFINPSTKEIMKSKDAGIVRYCIDLSKKKLYVWNPELLHEYMAKVGEKEGFLETNSYNLRDAVRNPYIWGVAKVYNGKLEIDEGDEWNQSNIDWDVLPKKLDKHGKDLSWLKHWWTPESYEDLSQ